MVEVVSVARVSVAVAVEPPRSPRPLLCLCFACLLAVSLFVLISSWLLDLGPAAVASGSRSTYFDCNKILPPSTVVRSDACCVSNTGVPVACSRNTTPFGKCSRSLNFPKPTPPRFHVMDDTCDENDPNAPFYDSTHGIYHLFWQKHCATPVPGENIKGIVYGHAVSRDLVHWARMPVAIWNDEPYDRNALYSGSATIVDGIPHIIYPGICLHDEWPADRKDRYCTNFIAAVPSDLQHDVLLENWTKPMYNPIVNGSAKDPSEAWQTSFGEWRFSDNLGNIYSSTDFKIWSSVGMLASFPKGDCPSMFPLPRSTPGARAPASGSQTPTHVHIMSDLRNPAGWISAEVGIYNEGPPRSTGGWQGLNSFAIDRGQTYAAKNFHDPVKNRTLMWSWATVQPNSTMALLREITWNPELEQLQFAPIDEQAELRDIILASARNVAIAPGTELPLGSSVDGAANQSEILVEFVLPSVSATFGVVVMGGGIGTASTEGSYFYVNYTPATHDKDHLAIVGAHDGGTRGHSSARDRPYITSRIDHQEAFENIQISDPCPWGANHSMCRPSSSLKLTRAESTVSLRIFIDQTFAEAYWQDGRAVMTVSVAPSAVASVALVSDASMIAKRVEAWTVKPIWVSREEVISSPRQVYI